MHMAKIAETRQVKGRAVQTEIGIRQGSAAPLCP
jgi:hypothetical protein